jgi:hypothetical protein
MNKKGRKPYPVEMRCVTTSLRLRPDRLQVFKQLGGTRWLNTMLDIEMFNILYPDQKGEEHAA